METTSLTRRALYPDPTVKELYDLLTYCQACSGSSVIVLIVESLEYLEDAFMVSGVYAYTVVPDGEMVFSGGGMICDPYGRLLGLIKFQTVADKVDELVNLDGHNVPAPLAMTGTTGPQQIVTRQESRQRRTSLRNMLMFGKSDDFIYEQMETEYGMSKPDVNRLKKELYAKLSKEEAERAPHIKTLAKNRMYDEIERAAADKQWTAVSGLEKTLAQVEGTIEEDGTLEHADARQLKALVMVLGELRHEEALKILEREREAFNLLPEKEVIDGEYEEYEDKDDDD